MIDGGGSREPAKDGRSCEDADSAGTDEEPDDDQDDAEHELSADRCDDAGDDEDDGENPEQGGHETSNISRSRRCDHVHSLTSSGGCLHPNG